MQNLIFLTAIIVSALLAWVLSPFTIGWIVFLLAGAVAGLLAQRMPPGSERVYWLALLTGLVLLGVSLAGANLGRLWIITPFVLAAAYFFARIVRKFTAQS